MKTIVLRLGFLNWVDKLHDCENAMRFSENETVCEIDIKNLLIKDVWNPIVINILSEKISISLVKRMSARVLSFRDILWDYTGIKMCLQLFLYTSFQTQIV